MSTVTIRDFDLANYLDSDNVILEYLKATAEEPNPEVFLEALGDVARAKGMTEIVKKTGLGRGNDIQTGFLKKSQKVVVGVMSSHDSCSRPELPSTQWPNDTAKDKFGWTEKVRMQ